MRLWWCLVVCACWACGDSAPPPLQLTPTPPPQPADPGAFVNPTLPPAPQGAYAASHVVVAWDGAVPPGPRSREEAVARARVLHGHAEAGPGFHELAKRTSDAPSAGRGGSLPPWTTGTYDPVFEAAVAATAISAVAPLIETSAGLHIIQREPVDRVRVQHLVFAWSGAVGASVTRSRERAETEASAAWQALRASEDPSTLGADLVVADVWLSRGQWVPAAEALAFSLGPGEVGGPVELPTGFVVVRRLP